jgi:hypothetical protein
VSGSGSTLCGIRHDSLSASPYLWVPRWPNACEACKEVAATVDRRRPPERRDGARINPTPRLDRTGLPSSSLTACTRSGILLRVEAEPRDLSIRAPYTNPGIDYPSRDKDLDHHRCGRIACTARRDTTLHGQQNADTLGRDHSPGIRVDVGPLRERPSTRSMPRRRVDHGTPAEAARALSRRRRRAGPRAVAAGAGPQDSHRGPPRCGLRRPPRQRPRPRHGRVQPRPRDLRRGHRRDDRARPGSRPRNEYPRRPSGTRLPRAGPADRRLRAHCRTLRRRPAQHHTGRLDPGRGQS